MLSIKKGEIRPLAMNVLRKSTAPIIFVGSPQYQIREYPYIAGFNVIVPAFPTLWDTAEITDNQVYAQIDTSDSWAITGMQYRIYFKVFVKATEASDTDTIKGYIPFSITD